MASISSLLRSGLISLTALAMLPSAAVAVPLARDMGAAALAGGGGPDKPILVWQGEGRDRGPGYRFWPRGGRNWGGGRHWGGGGGRHWGGGDWDRGHWRRGGHWGGWGGWGSGFALGLGFGVPLGYYGGAYDDYPGYYDEPIYRPRYRPRVYRAPRYLAPRDYRYPRAQTGDHCDNVYLRGSNFSGCYNNNR
jgi:hypothetical protein